MKAKFNFFIGLLFFCAAMLPPFDKGSVMCLFCALLNAAIVLSENKS